MNVTWKVWLTCSFMFLMLELATTALVFIWLMVGALFASIVATFVDNLFVQFLVFVISSAILLMFSKSFYEKRLKKEQKDEILEKFLEKIATVKEDIPSSYEPGEIVVNGVIWKATSITGERINKGSLVVVKSIDGLTLGVKLLKSKED